MAPLVQGLVARGGHGAGDDTTMSMEEAKLIFTKGELKEVSEEVAKYKFTFIGFLIPNTCCCTTLFVNAYKNVLAVVVKIDFSFLEVDKIKQYLKDPSKFVVVVVVVVVAAALATEFGAPTTTKEKEKKEELGEESNDDITHPLGN
ncbi:60S acidic ribosomal protein P0-like [Glycine soja]|uniref:60S acidic ribosomal protein P0-like n=1 Tax=Glycine soja TaxID=3848 RepID=UPI0003DEC9A8|nr:60S acidic ribosomal protein P0-like [Glycine soja]|eukprot:XP_006596639.1 60S acidic ribosomal protein P0-like [Glycine max]